MGWFETIQGDGFLGTLDVESEVLVRARENFVWAIIGMLKWFPDGVMADKDMCTSAKAVRDVNLALRRTNWGCSKLLHGSPKATYIAGRVCSCCLTVRVKELTR